MTTVSITEDQESRFHDVSGSYQSVGKTLGEALDAVTKQMLAGETPALVVIQKRAPDSFFTADQASTDGRSAITPKSASGFRAGRIAGVGRRRTESHRCQDGRDDSADWRVNPRYFQIVEQAGWRCEYCHAPESVFNFAFQVGHIYPQSRGGDNVDDNLAPACSACNLYKSDAVTGMDANTGLETSLFDPRGQLWSDHFAFERETARIVGITNIGRATVDRLQMNTARQLQA